MTQGSTRARLAAAGSALLLSPSLALAADVEVRVTGIKEPNGKIACTLFTGPDGFPAGHASALVQWVQAEAATARCQFANVARDRVAVAVFQDLNLNGRLDSNFVGIPAEPWGVSNRVRPALRAPRFDEAMVVRRPGLATVVDVDLAQ